MAMREGLVEMFGTSGPAWLPLRKKSEPAAVLLHIGHSLGLDPLAFPHSDERDNHDDHGDHYDRGGVLFVRLPCEICRTMLFFRRAA